MLKLQSETERISITAIILTQDEAVNICACINALARVEDVVIVDSGSKDKTLALAQQVRPDVTIFEHPFQDFGAQRNWALDHTAPRHDWVLFIDADEFCDPELLDEIAAFVATPGKSVGGFIAGRNVFKGTWLRYCTMYPSYQLRLLKRGQVQYRREGHGQREVTDGALHYFQHGWRHEGFSKGIDQWIDRHNHYSSDEVELVLRLRKESLRLADCLFAEPVARRRALKVLVARLPARPLLGFLYKYVWRRGFLDGRAGLHYCLLLMAHDLHICVKLWERQRADGGLR